MCKKVLDEETLSKSEDELDIIDYPNQSSIIPYNKKEEVKPPNIYLIKKIQSLKLQKIEKLEQTNLTLSEDDIDNEIEEKEISHNIDINIINEQNEPDLVLSNKKNKENSGNEKKKETVYKKKVIVPNTSLNNKDNTFCSLSFLSNVTSSKISNKNQSKAKKYEKTQTRLVRSSKKKIIPKIDKEESNIEDKNILTNNNSTNINMNDIKLYENFQKFKQIEQLLQLKEFEKIKSLLELQKNANLIYSNNKFSNESRNYNTISQQNYQNIPNIQNMNLTYPLPQTNQKVDLNEPEPRACKNCEEIYKYLIIHNLPIKMITCLYCHREMNMKTLEYYINECKNELKEKYKKEVSNKNNNINQKEDKFGDISTEKISSDEDEESEKDDEENEQEEEEEKKEETTKSNNKNKQKLINISNDREEESEEIQNISKTPKKQDKQNENKTFNNIKIIQPSSLQNSSTKMEPKSQNESMFFTGNSLNNTTSNNNVSLAEAFRSRHSKIIKNIEKRAHSIKEKSVSTEISSNNLEMQNIYKKLNRTNNSQTKDDIKQISLSRQVNTSRSVTEPSPELMNRLIKGERAKMSQKEMRELNNRIYNRLPDVIGQKEDDGKKEELTKLKIIKKNYTEKLKEKVVKKFKGKKLKIPPKKPINNK